MNHFHHSLLLRFLAALLVSPLFLTSLLAQNSDSEQAEDGAASDRKPGITVIVEATGSAQIIEAHGAAPQPALKGQRVPEGGAVVTGPDGRIDLALSNGAFFQIQENSRFVIGQFEQEDYEFVFSNSEAIRRRDIENIGDDKAAMITMDSSEDAWNKMPQEPTVSASKFALDYGTMIGETKKLRPGSSMEISTPIGTAGIRGTIWRLTIQPVGPAGSNAFRGTLDVGRGLVNFSNPQGNRAVDVSGGFSMQIEVSVQAGQIRVNSINTSPMSPERIAYLQGVTQAVQGIQIYFQAVQGTPADVGVTTDSTATGQNDGTTNQSNEGDANRPQVDTPSPTLINPGGGTSQVVPPPFVPTPTPAPTPPNPTPAPTPPNPTPSPTLTPTPVPSNI